MWFSGFAPIVVPQRRLRRKFAPAGAFPFMLLRSHGCRSLRGRRTERSSQWFPPTAIFFRFAPGFGWSRTIVLPNCEQAAQSRRLRPGKTAIPVTHLTDSTRRHRPGTRSLAKEELLTVEGIIDEILPDGRFGVMLDNEHRIIAYTAGKMRRFRIRSVVGDRVHVEMTPYDLSKGRVIFREKVAGQPAGARRRGYRR